MGCIILGQQATYRRVCYYTNWSQYRSNDMKFFPNDVDPFLCTHINFAFAKLEGNQIATTEWNDEQMYAYLTGLIRVKLLHLFHIAPATDIFVLISKIKVSNMKCRL